MDLASLMPAPPVILAAAGAAVAKMLQRCLPGPGPSARRALCTTETELPAKSSRALADAVSRSGRVWARCAPLGRVLARATPQRPPAGRRRRRRIAADVVDVVVIVVVVAIMATT